MDARPSSVTGTRASITHGPTSTGLSGPKPLSCTSCRQRKVKCNKVHPCGPCQKSGIQCVFPQRMRVPRVKPGESKARDTELLRRIGRLESLVSKVDAAKAFIEQQGGLQESIDNHVKNESPKVLSAHRGPITDPFAVEVKHGNLTESFATFVQWQDRGSGTLSSQFWSTLGDEVEGLRALLEHSQDEDDEAVREASLPLSSTPKPCISGFPLSTSMVFGNGDVPHPIDQHRLTLMRIYIERVHPCSPIFHKPTMNHTLITTNELIDPVTKHYKFPSIEAMTFAMYYSATMSMSNDECLQFFNEGRDQCLARYQQGTEIALAKADFLNSNEVVTLTAFILYLIAARSSDNSRSVWTMLSLAVRIAHSIGLHRDGDGRHLSAFEAEMRRRTWWQLVILDMRACEDRGSAGVIGDGTFNTIMPCNINDDEFTMASKHPLPNHKGLTEMSYFLISADVADIMRRTNFISPSGDARGMSLDDKEKLIKDCATRIEANYTEGIDISGPKPNVLSVLGRIMTLRLWSVLQYPFQKQKNETGLVWPAGAALRTAGNIIELIMMMEAHPDSTRFLWFYKTWVPWHPVAMALAELCKTPHGELADRSWPIVEAGYKICGERIADSKQGMLWRPVRKLYRRAQALRLGQVPPASDASFSPTSATHAVPKESLNFSPSIQRSQPTQSDPRPATTLSPLSGTQNLHIQQPGSLDAFQATDSNMFGAYGDLDWLPPTDFNMAGTEDYGAPVNWDDWNNFIFNASNGQDMTADGIYSGDQSATIQGGNVYGWPYMPQ